MKKAHIMFDQNLAISTKVQSGFTTSDRLWLVVDCQRIAHQKHYTLLVTVKTFNLKVVGWKKKYLQIMGRGSIWPICRVMNTIQILFMELAERFLKPHFKGMKNLKTNTVLHVCIFREANDEYQANPCIIEELFGPPHISKILPF